MINVVNHPTRFKKKQHHNNDIGFKRSNITWYMLQRVKKEDIKEFMDELMRLIKTPARGQLKAMEIFLKLVATLPKQEIEQLGPSYTLVPKPIDITTLKVPSNN